MFIAGEWTTAESGETFEAESPVTGEAIGVVQKGERADAQRAIEAANAAAPEWGRLSAFERATYLHRVADEVEKRRDALVHSLTLDQGKPLAESRDEVEELVQYWRNAAEEGKRLEGRIPNSVSTGTRVLLMRRPRGVIGVITPWNWPYTMAAEVVAPALASGNTVVWTPASSTAVCSVKLAQCVVDTELPAGVFNLVTGPGPVVGDEIAGNAGTHAIGFVGSIATGFRVAERAAGKSLLLEMGGNGPLVVLDDADLDAAVEATLAAAFLCAGQSCTAGERFLVHEEVHDEFLDRLTSAVSSAIRVGDPFAGETTMGPLNNEGTAAKMDSHVGDAVERGAVVVAGGARATGFPTNLYYEATVLDRVTDEMEVAKEETFGPVVPITTIQSEDEALALINSSPYGLLTAVFTRDLGRGLRFAEAARAGWVNVNESTNYWESHLPFGGRAGSQSGIGRVGGRFSMETFTELKTVVVNLG
jgi:acyl-CoA reductase-like NAD-dependent aldehyde dehydrogenase